jgi:hypothetical protein
MNVAIAAAWSRHGKDTKGVAATLPELVARCTAEHAGALGGLIVHVMGEHLGRWDDGVALCEALPEGPFRTRTVATLQLAAGIPTQLVGSDRARVLAGAASAVVAHGRGVEAFAWLQEAADLCGALPDDEPAVRALAVAANNLAVALEAQARTPADDDLLRVSATLALDAWSRAGTWMNVERAEYRLSKALAALGDAEGAVLHANRCIQICAANGADALEQLYGYECLAVALGVSGNTEGAQAAARGARSLLAAIAPDSREAVALDLDALDRLLA